MIRYIALLCWIACATPAPKAEDNRAPDILLITLNATRWIESGAYGDPLARTPSLDALADKAYCSGKTYTTVPLTLASPHRL